MSPKRIQTAALIWHTKQTHGLDYELRTRHLTHGQWACKMNIWPDVVSAGKNYTYKSVFTGGQLYRNDQTFPARFHFMERFLLKGIHSTLNALMDMVGLGCRSQQFTPVRHQ